MLCTRPYTCERRSPGLATGRPSVLRARECALRLSSGELQGELARYSSGQKRPDTQTRTHTHTHTHKRQNHEPRAHVRLARFG
eukprot:7264921-Pyramimonas_sp.AAC.1